MGILDEPCKVCNGVRGHTELCNLSSNKLVDPVFISREQYNTLMQCKEESECLLSYLQNELSWEYFREEMLSDNAAGKRAKELNSFLRDSDHANKFMIVYAALKKDAEAYRLMSAPVVDDDDDEDEDE
jgi:hypothetical protein